VTHVAREVVVAIEDDASDARSITRTNAIKETLATIWKINTNSSLSHKNLRIPVEDLRSRSGKPPTPQFKLLYPAAGHWP